MSSIPENRACSVASLFFFSPEYLGCIIMSTPTIFFQPSTASVDLSLLEGQVNSLKSDVGLVKADLSGATSGGTANTLVRRDINKDFATNKIKLDHLESAGATLSIAGDPGTTTLNMGSGTGVQAINLGSNGTGATTIKLGGGSDSVQVNLPLKDASGTVILSTNASTNLRVGPNVLPSDRGQHNTFLGSNIANAVNGPASYNTGVGSGILSNLTTGSGHTAVGSGAGSSLATGGNNTFVGISADTAGTNAALISNSTALGAGAKVDTDNTIQLGNTAVTAVKTSGTLTAAGLESVGTTLNIASQNNTSTVNIGSGTAVQAINLGSNGTGATAIRLGGGSDTVQVNLPLKNASGANILHVSGTTALGQANVAVGPNVLPSTVGVGNILVGCDISVDSTSAAAYNTAMGSLALQSLTTGTFNSAHGHRALCGVTTGEANVGIGYRAGYNPSSTANTLTTGSRNILIGPDSKTATSTMTNSCAIGWGAVVDSDNSIQLGNGNVTAVKTSGVLTAAGLTTTGNVVSSAAPTAANHLTNKAYVDSKAPAYEEFDWPTTWKYSSPENYTSTVVNFKIVKVGKVVTMSVTNLANFNPPEVAGYWDTTSALPARFLPAGNATAYSRCPVTVKNGAAFETGSLAIPAGGAFLRVVAGNGAEFSTTGERFFLPFHVSWVTE
jgi:hypothetical protein